VDAKRKGALLGLKQLLPGSLAGSLRPKWQSFRRLRINAYHKAAGLVGLNIAKRGDYYSVLPSLEKLQQTRARWNRPSALPGVHYDLLQMRGLFDELLKNHADDVSQVERYRELAAKGFGPGYPRVDAIVLYAMIRRLKPARYFEVGSGLSTYFAWLAGQQNAKEGRPLQITCVEPYPRDLLKSMAGVELIIDEVQNVPLEKFAPLESGDVLFIDSTHALRIDSDVAYLFMEVVPRVKAGVHVHVHDIPFPYNVPYPADVWMFGHRWPVFWQEAMVLQSFLAFNESFRMNLSVSLIQHADESFLPLRVPGFEASEIPADVTSSLWMERVK